ncbi:MAG: DUF1049 domain-containing protein [Proteobacteria bacterium]|nr:DUF1049 domain-containing protein [Pseudomonadota bacterium]
MRLFRWLFALPVGLVVVLFAVSNLETVTLKLWPFDLALVSPLYLAVLLVALLAFLAGAVTAWVSGHRWRARARRDAQRAAELEREVAALRRRAEGAGGGRDTLLPPSKAA